MLQKMREHSQSMATKILLGVLIIVFTMFGFGAFEAFIQSEPPAAVVNGTDITQAHLAMETERQKQQILAQMGEKANPDLIDEARLKTSVLERLINQTVLMDSAKKMGLRVSEGEVDRLITQNPQFMTDNKFDRDLYTRLLANLGYSSAHVQNRVHQRRYSEATHECDQRDTVRYGRRGARRSAVGRTNARHRFSGVHTRAVRGLDHG